MLTQLYRLEDDGTESRFWVESSVPLSVSELETVWWLIAETYEPEKTGDVSFLEGREIVEIGPRLSVATPFSSNRVSSCLGAGVLSVARVEVSRRFAVTDKMTRERILAEHLDPLTQQEYPATLTHLTSDVLPQPVRVIDVLGENGAENLSAINKELGLGLDMEARAAVLAYFRRVGRNPTDVELFGIGNGQSDHCRHGTWNGTVVIDGEAMPRTLMQLAKEPLAAIPAHLNSTAKAFNDNAGVLNGTEVAWFMPEQPGTPSSYTFRHGYWCIAHTAETHNHPTKVAPYPGAATGAGGEIRDEAAVGRGGIPMAGFAGYCVGALWTDEKVPGCATPLQIIIEGSNGISDYRNQIGLPVIGGFFRSFDMEVAGERYAFIKPILYSAGVSRVQASHLQKTPPQKGMLVVQIGGPAFRIGVGGGAASSMMPGENTAELDLQSVQRGNAAEENKGNRVIRVCVDLGDDNPICSIHDQGAGGPHNVLTELLGHMGGELDIRQITVGDPSMSVLELWSAEFQERYGLLIYPSKLDLFRDICAREGVNCEVLGVVTGDGFIRVRDSRDGSTPVELDLSVVTGDMSHKTLQFTRVPRALPPLVLPDGFSLAEALRKVFALPNVGSKGFLVHKADRSVGGLVAQQQCCGVMQIPVADVGVMADSFVGFTGGASSLGEQPIVMLLNSAAGARMAVGEALTNMAGALVSAFTDIRYRANWMWPAKCEGEGARLYDAAVAMSDVLKALGLAIDGGKDSSSMATQVGERLVKSPGSLVMFGNVRTPDICKTVTPDLKHAGGSCLGFVDLGQGKNRLGGSSLAQAYGQLGSEPPDVDDPDLLRRAFLAVQELIARGLLLAYHDRSDGGLITTLVEMCLAGNVGATISILQGDPVPWLFSEELGMVMEYLQEDRESIQLCFRKYDVMLEEIGWTDNGLDLVLEFEAEGVVEYRLTDLRKWWEATSTRLDAKQANSDTVNAEWRSFEHVSAPPYVLTFTPKESVSDDIAFRPPVAVLRASGTNGDREMAAALYTAGLGPVDVSMSDLLAGRVTLDSFLGLVFCGGFSNMDVFGSAKGWAAAIRFNAGLRDQFDRFYHRPDTFSLGVCNGCQLMALLGWVPWRDISDVQQPRFIHNTSQRFESRWSRVVIQPSPSILLRGMEGSQLGVWVAHGEGRVFFPEPSMLMDAMERQLAPLAFVNPGGEPTEAYPYNPNGSPHGITALCSPDGRHLAMMPHPERCFRMVQWPHAPESWKHGLAASPWLQMFQNAKQWCRENLPPELLRSLRG